jgi:molybdopterin synthase catalytic subunit
MGGLTICKIVEDEILLDDLIGKLTTNSTGAVVMFNGIVRQLTNMDVPFETTQLEYEAYRPMAEKKMCQVAEEIRIRWPDVESIAIIQRIGILKPGTPTVTIACSAAHRNTGVFEAAKYGIDRLKEIVPIWKKESSSNGETWIEGKYIPRPNDIK